jgi:hypothetical protein
MVLRLRIERDDRQDILTVDEVRESTVAQIHAHQRPVPG